MTEGENPEPIDFKRIRERTTSHVYVMYMNYQFLIKGGVFTVAALALFRILTTQDLQFRMGLFAFWSASFLFTIVSTAKFSRGAVLTNARFNMMDLVLPIFIALPEYLLFITLDPGFQGHLGWRVWYFAIVGHAFFVILLVANRLSQTQDGDFAPEVQEDLLPKYRSWLARDLMGAGAIFGAGIFLFLFPPPEIASWFLSNVNSEQSETVVGAILCLVAAGIILEASREYRYIIRVAHVPS